jgi:uncharacterized membrane protein
MLATIHPFDWRTVLLAKHAQHVVLIHFPIALYLVGVLMDFAGRMFGQESWEEAAYWNFLVAAVFTLPVLATGIIAWQWALEGQRLKGILLWHLSAGIASSVAIWITAWMHFVLRRGPVRRFLVWSAAVEVVGVILLMITGHLGGFLSGVNGGQ